MKCFLSLKRDVAMNDTLEVNEVKRHFTFTDLSFDTF